MTVGVAIRGGFGNDVLIAPLQDLGEDVGIQQCSIQPALIREALQRGQLTGTQRVADEIARKLSIRVEHRGRGRPRRSQK